MVCASPDLYLKEQIATVGKVNERTRQKLARLIMVIEEQDLMLNVKKAEFVRSGATPESVFYLLHNVEGLFESNN